MTVVPGDAAPDFSMSDADRNTVSLNDLAGQRVVLFFYPRDNTPGCTKEACDFRDAYDELQQKGVEVIGVSTDSETSHAKFIKKNSLPFRLLVDNDGAVGTLYDCYGLKKMYGKEYMGITRSTFIIGPEGVIEKVYRKVKPKSHVAEVIADIEELTGTAS